MDLKKSFREKIHEINLREKNKFWRNIFSFFFAKSFAQIFSRKKFQNYIFKKVFF
jgi:hypothetical protein